MHLLDERKMKILQAIIRNYLETGEPVGSRTISKYTDLNLSSATIRNEMADLEELGYIVQPHTSAGRIPSDKGYRLYVDQMMEEKEREVEELKEFLLEREDKMEHLLKQVAKVLAQNTNYATMISAPIILMQCGEPGAMLINVPPIPLHALMNSCPLIGAMIKLCIPRILIRIASS